MSCTRHGEAQKDTITQCTDPDGRPSRGLRGGRGEPVREHRARVCFLKWLEFHQSVFFLQNRPHPFQIIHDVIEKNSLQEKGSFIGVPFTPETWGNPTTPVG